MNAILTPVGALLLLAACSESPTPPTAPTGLAPAAAATVVRGVIDEPFSGLTTSCDGEPMAFQGRMLFRWHNTFLPSGHWQLTQHERFHAQGTGLDSGRRYLFQAIYNETQIFAVPDGGAFTYNGVYRVHGIVQGNGDNDFFEVNGKWTITPKGVVTVDIGRVEYLCRG